MADDEIDPIAEIQKIIHYLTWEKISCPLSQAHCMEFECAMGSALRLRYILGQNNSKIGEFSGKIIPLVDK